MDGVRVPELSAQARAGRVVRAHERPVYRAVALGVEEVRRLEWRLSPFRAGDEPVRTVREADVDVWSFPRPQAGVRVWRGVVDGTAGVRSCAPCRGAGRFDCRSCGADGRRGCGRCSGQGRVRCSSCDGEGRTRCGTCGGTSRERCSSCGGDGRRLSNKRCAWCSGSGKRSCSSCSAGRKPCLSCSTQGRVSCRDCSGRGEVTCADCRGEGERMCRDCSGAGRVKEWLEVSIEFVTRRVEETSTKLGERWRARVKETGEPVPVDATKIADGELRDWLVALPLRLPYGDRARLRVHGVTVWRVPAVVAEYEMGGAPYELLVAGGGLVLAESPVSRWAARAAGEAEGLRQAGRIDEAEAAAREALRVDERCGADATIALVDRERRRREAEERSRQEAAHRRETLSLVALGLGFVALLIAGAMIALSVWRRRRLRAG